MNPRHDKTLLRPLTTIAALLLAAAPAAAQCALTENQSTAGSNVGPVDFFGSVAAATGDVAVFGAPNHNLGSLRDAGNAYVFRRVGGSWIEETPLQASNPAQNDQFGSAVATDGTIVVVGARQSLGGTIDHGKADVFRWNGTEWDHEQELKASDGEDGDLFGAAVAVDGSLIVVGAPGDDEVFNGSGSAYVFEHDGTAWNQVQKLTAGNPSDTALFGESLAVQAGTLIVGSTNDDTGGANSGAAYVFTRGASFVQQQVVTPSDLGPFYGRAIALSSSRAVVGSGSDKAYMLSFDGTSWSEDQIVTGSDTVTNDLFGQAVALDGTLAIIGAHMNHHGGLADSGAAYAFRHDGQAWREVTKLVPAAPSADAEMGVATAVVGDNAISCASHDSSFSFAGGAAYAFTVPMLGLDVQPSPAIAGGLVNLLTCGGAPGDYGFLFATSLNGLPLPAPSFVLWGQYDSAGQWNVPLLIHPGGSGISIGLRTYGLLPSGTLIQSNDDVLAVN